MGSGVTTPACSRPGDEAIERIEAGLNTLISLAERRDRGELDQRALTAALTAWEQTEGAEIAMLSSEAARALGPPLRAELAERWRAISERLRARLSVHSPKALGLP